MIIKLTKDHIVKHSPFCGEIRETLTADEFGSLDIALAIDISRTTAHYHKGFDEIYFVLDGFIDVRFYDPGSGEIWTQCLSANELCVITRGIHHGITTSSERNRLCVITVPRFDEADEHESDRI